MKFWTLDLQAYNYDLVVKNILLCCKKNISTSKVKNICEKVQNFTNCLTFLEKGCRIDFHSAICTCVIMPSPSSPFTREQERWIIFRYGACQSVRTIRREFRRKFNVSPFSIPRETAFYRVLKRFNTSNSTVPKSKKVKSVAN